jgi:hypothetical protein
MADSLTTSIRVSASSPVDVAKEGHAVKRSTYVFHELLDDLLSEDALPYKLIRDLDPLLEDWLNSRGNRAPGLPPYTGMMQVAEQGADDSRIFAQVDNLDEAKFVRDEAAEERIRLNEAASTARAGTDGLIDWVGKSGLVSRLLNLR